MGSQTSYRDLKVWQAAMSLAEEVYRPTARFPKDELYGMTSQIRRAAVSIAANIAEGYGRDNDGSFTQFLRISRGSLKELETHLLLAVRIELASEASSERSIDLRGEIGRMLRSFVEAIQRRRGE